MPRAVAGQERCIRTVGCVPKIEDVLIDPDAVALAAVDYKGVQVAVAVDIRQADTLAVIGPQGLATVDDKMVILLDIDRLINNGVLAQIEEAAE